MADVKILYHGRDESIKLIDTGRDILTYLTMDPQGMCPLMDKDIKLVKKLGEGKYGAVFSINLKGQGSRRYVVKKAKADDENMGKKAFSRCIVRQPYIVGVGKDITRINDGDIVCSMVVTEYLISLLVGEFARKGKSANFFDTFYFTTCGKYHYTFMEKIDRSLLSTLKCVSERTYKGKTNAKNPMTINYIAVQVLHALGMIQSQYAIVHGDLHTDNIFLEIVDENTTFAGKKLLDCHYYEYRVDGTSIYIPGGKACPFIVKLGDWGIACKYSPRKILNEQVAEDGMTDIKGKMWLPNFYAPSYDVIYSMHVLQALNPSNSFLNNIMRYCGKIKEDGSIKRFTNSLYPRPRITDLNSKYAHVSPTSILTSKELMGDFLKRPDVDDDKIVLLGEY